MELLVANDVVRAVCKNAICGKNNAGNSPTGEGTRM